MYISNCEMNIDIVGMTNRLECLIDDIRVREVVVGKEVELVQKIPNVNTTERIHLRKWQHARETEICQPMLHG